MDENLPRELTNKRLNETSLNEYGRFDKLKEKRNEEKTKAFFEACACGALPRHKIAPKFNNLLRDFVLGRLDDVLD